MERFKHALFTVLISATFATLSACGPVDDNVGGTQSAVATDASGNPTVGVITNTTGFYVRSIQSTAYSYYDHIYSTTTATTPLTVGSFTSGCSIADGTTGTDLNCIIEGKEEDLWFNGIQLQYNVPSDMCTYLVIEPYSYYVMEPHFGVSALSYDLDDTSGAISNVVNTDPTYVNVDGTGNITCRTNYSLWLTGAPNCCEGKYTLTIHHSTAGTPDSVVNGDYGGLIANCLDGPVTTLPKQTNGFPIYPEYYIESAGKNDVLKVTAPNSLNVLGGHQTQSNIYVANYLDVTNELNGTLPDAFDPSAHQAGVSATNQYYRFSCLDRSFDVLNRINVQVRSWDTVAQYDNMKTSITSAALPACAACPLCAGGVFNNFAAQMCWGTACPFSGLGTIGAALPQFGCNSANGDLENTPFGTEFIHDHLTWRSHFMYFTGKNASYIGVVGAGPFSADPALGMYPGVTILSRPSGL